MFSNFPPGAYVYCTGFFYVYMGKRMTATEKWDKVWFMNLSPKLKCLWMYINDKCDQAGMWEVNYKLAQMHIGEPISDADINVFGDKIEFYSEDKVWIVGHVLFQCGNLSDRSPAHKPIFTLLKKYRLLDRVLNRVSNTLQEKEIEREKDKEEEKETKTPRFGVTISDKNEAWQMLSSDPLIMEDARLTVSQKGWKGYDDTDIHGIMFTFIAKTGMPVDRDDFRRYWRNWLFRESNDKRVQYGKNDRDRQRLAPQVRGTPANIPGTG